MTDPQGEAVWTALPVPVIAPFNGLDLLALLTLLTVPGLSQVAGTVFERSVLLAGGPAVLRIDCGGALPVACGRLSTPDDAAEAAGLCAGLVDAGCDPAAVDRVLSADPTLAGSVAAMPGVRMPACTDGAEMLICTIVGQQISVAAARTAQARIVARFGDRLPADLQHESVTHLFPSPERLAVLSVDDLGMPRSRAATVIGAARDLAAGTLRVSADRDRDRLVADLLKRPGIGPWTAGYVAMHVVGATDELLVGDLVLRAGARELGLPYAPRELAAYGARWSPYRSYAGLHLWRAALLTSRGGWPVPSGLPLSAIRG